MDIKIRSQAGGMLIDCTNKDIKLGGKLNELNQVIASDFSGVITLGIYRSMEEATKVIDFIQDVIEKGFKQKNTGVIILMPN